MHKTEGLRVAVKYSHICTLRCAVESEWQHTRRVCSAEKNIAAIPQKNKISLGLCLKPAVIAFAYLLTVNFHFSFSIKAPQTSIVEIVTANQ